MKNFTSYLIRPVFRVALVALMFSLPVGLAAAAEAAPEFITEWGSYGSGDGFFKSPAGIAVDGAGNVYVADTGNNRIQKFDAVGTYVTKWGSYGSGDGQFLGPFGIAVDGEGNVYVADTWNNRIQKFDADGNDLTQGDGGWGDGKFSLPTGIAVDSEGNVYVADMGNNCIQKFDADGTYVTEWDGSEGDGGQFSNPWDVAVDGTGKVYVADYYNHRIQKFGGDGEYVTQWGSEGTGDGQFNSPMGITVDGAGNVYVADMGNHRIQKFDGDGTYLTKWGSFGSGDGQFDSPMGIAVDGAGNVYVADTYNARIQKFGNPFIEVDIDIRPWSRRNPLNMRSRGVLPVAILGSEDFDVRDIIDVSTITLNLKGAEGGAKPIHWMYRDISKPLKGDIRGRRKSRRDGYEDLFLIFRTGDVVNTVRALGEVNNGDEVLLTARGSLEDGTQFEGEDSVKIIQWRSKRHWKWWKCNKGRK